MKKRIKRKLYGGLISVGIDIVCDYCGFSSAICSGYGGIYDHHVFECKDCKKYFYVNPEHVDFSDTLIGKLFPWLEPRGYDEIKFFNYAKKNKIHCDDCGGENIREIYALDYLTTVSDLYEKEKIDLECPVCGENLFYDGEAYFDDE